MEIKLAVKQVRKAIAAAVASAVVGVVGRWINIDVATVEVIVNAVIVAGVVWAVPNAKDVFDA